MAYLPRLFANSEGRPGQAPWRAVPALRRLPPRPRAPAARLSCGDTRCSRGVTAAGAQSWALRGTSLVLSQLVSQLDVGQCREPCPRRPGERSAELCSAGFLTRHHGEDPKPRVWGVTGTQPECGRNCSSSARPPFAGLCGFWLCHLSSCGQSCTKGQSFEVIVYFTSTF